MKPLVVMTAIEDEQYTVDWTETFLSWEYWCKKHNVQLHIQRKPYTDTRVPMWTDKWDTLKVINDIYPDTTHIAMIDADVMVRWDCPNIFEYITDNSKVYAGLDGGPMQGLKWMLDVWRPLFPESTKEPFTYFNAGVLLMSIDMLKNVTEKIWDCFSKRESVDYSYNVWDEQTPLNHIVGDDLIILPSQFNDMIMFKYDDYSFINQSFIWHFTGPRMGGWSNRPSIIKTCWDHIKSEYDIAI